MGKKAGAPAASQYRAAFAKAYATYYSRIFAYIYSRLNSVEVAKDLTAAVFEKAYAKGCGLRDQQAFPAWLFMIARNTVAGYFRQRRRDHRYWEEIKGSFLGRTTVDEPSERAIHDETAARVMAFVRRLSPREQELLALKFEGELSNGEIARVMGMSPVNVRVSLFRALAKLRDKMKEMGD